MRLLYCIPGLEHGGAERQLSYLAAEMARMGHEVHLAARRGGPNLDRMLAAGVVWHPLGGRDYRGPAIFLWLVRLVRKFVIFFELIALVRRLRPDVVQTILGPMDMLGGAAALLTRTRWVMKESSSAEFYATDRRFWLRYAFGRLSDAVVANSAGGYEYWRAALGERRLHLIPNAIPLDEIARADSGRVSGFGFGPEEKVVLYAGRIAPGKNVEGLVAALARIGDETPFVALVCGDGSSRRSAERAARELGVAHRIVFTGNVDNLWDLMKRADAFVFLSRYEGRPNVVLEAMACGCPVVVSDIPAHREMLDERSALFVDPDDTEGAAAAVKATLAGGEAARARARAALSRGAGLPVEAAARLYEQLYLGLLGESRAANREGLVSGREAA